MEEKPVSSVINTEIKNESEMQQAIHTKSTEQGTIHILRKHFQGGRVGGGFKNGNVCSFAVQ